MGIELVSIGGRKVSLWLLYLLSLEKIARILLTIGSKWALAVSADCLLSRVESIAVECSHNWFRSFCRPSVGIDSIWTSKEFLFCRIFHGIFPTCITPSAGYQLHIFIQGEWVLGIEISFGSFGLRGLVSIIAAPCFLGHSLICTFVEASGLRALKLWRHVRLTDVFVGIVNDSLILFGRSLHDILSCISYRRDIPMMNFQHFGTMSTIHLWRLLRTFHSAYEK